MDNELLLFEIRSVAEGAVKGFQEAGQAIREVGEAYEGFSKKEEEASAATQQSEEALKGRTKAQDDNTNSTEKNSGALGENKEKTLALVGAITALIGFIAGLKRGLDAATESYNQQRSALVGLRSIVEGTGGSFGKAQKALDDFVSDGLIPISDASTALKNLLARGFNLDESIELLNRLKDSAAFGRQSSLELGEAVRSATEGLKNENSVLVDNAGVTKNVSAMWKDYAAELGVGVQSLTLAQKRQAEYNGIMAETQHQVGDAKKLSGEFAGSQASLTAGVQQLKVALGEAATGGLAPFNKALAGGVKGAADFIKAYSPLFSALIQGGKVFVGGSVAALLFSSSLAATRASLVATIPALSAVTGAFSALKAAMASPWGIAIGALAGLIGIVTGISSASEKAAENMQQLNDEIKQLSSDVAGATALVTRYEVLSKQIARSAAETAEMKQISSDLVETYAFRADAIGEEGKGIATNLSMMKEQLEIERESLRLKLQEAESNNTKTYQEAQKNLTSTKAAYEDMIAKNASLRQSYKEVQDGIYNVTDAAREMGYVTQDLNGREMLDALDWRSFLEIQSQVWDQNEQDMLAKIEEYNTAINSQIQNGIDLAIATSTARGQEIPQALRDSMSQAMADMAEEDSEGELGSETANNFIKRYFDIEDAAGLAESKIEEVNQLRQMILSGLATSDADTEQAATFASTLLGQLADESALAGALESGKSIRQKLEEGMATTEEKSAWDKIREDGKAGIAALENTISTESKKLNIDPKNLLDSLDKIGEGFNQTADEITKAALDKKIQKMSMGDLVSEVESVTNAYKNLKEEMRSHDDLQSAIDVIRSGATDTDDYTSALQWLADQYGITTDEVGNNLDAFQSDADMTSALIKLKIALAEAEVSFAIAMVQSMADSNSAVANNAGPMIANLQGILNQLNAVKGSIDDVNGTTIDYQANAGLSDQDIKDGKSKRLGKINANKTGGSKLFDTSAYKPSWSGYSGRGGGGGGGGGGRRSSGGGGGSSRSAYKNEALDKELERLENLKKLNKLTANEEIAALKKVLRVHCKTADERQEVTEKLYAVMEAKAKSDYQYKKSMDQLTLADEIRMATQKRNRYKGDTQAWRDASLELYALQKQQRREIFDNDVYFGRLTLERQREWIKSQISRYKAGVKARIDLEKELFDITKQIRDRDVEHINTITDAIKTAVTERYNVQRRAEEERLNKSIKQWSDWSDAQQKAIQEQIAAIDELSKAEDRDEQEKKRKRDIAALEQRLLYENDAYNRQKLAEELAKKEDEYRKWKTANERQDLKAALQKQSEAVAETAKAEQDKLNAKLEALGKYYDELTKDSAVRAQTEKLLMQSSQKELLSLLQTYAPEYDLIGQSMGERLVSGFTSKVGDIDKWFSGFTDKIESYKSQMAGAANRAATAYWINREAVLPNKNTAETPVAVPGSAPQITVYFNQPIKSPSEITRELERLADNLGRL